MRAGFNTAHEYFHCLTRAPFRRHCHRRTLPRAGPSHLRMLAVLRLTAGEVHASMSSSSSSAMSELRASSSALNAVNVASVRLLLHHFERSYCTVSSARMRQRATCTCSVGLCGRDRRDRQSLPCSSACPAELAGGNRRGDGARGFRHGSPGVAHWGLSLSRGRPEDGRR